MGIQIIGWIPKIIKVAASVLGVDSVKDVVDALENNKLTPDQRVALDAATKQYALEMRGFDLEEVKSTMTQAIAELQSPDKYVSRARPTILYVASGISIFLAVVLGIVIIKHTTIEWGAVGAMSSLLGTLFGVSGYYVGKRTAEKLNGNGNGD